MRGRRSRVEFCSVEKSNLLFAEAAALKIDVQQERSLRSELLWGFGLLWPGLKSAAHTHCDRAPIWLIQRLSCLLNQDVLIRLRECPETFRESSEMLDLFQGTPGQSVCSLLICLFLPFFFLSFTSEASPQVVAYFTVAMATAHGKPRVFDREEEEKKKPFTYL